MGLRTGPKTSPFAGWSGLGYGLYGPVRGSNFDYETVRDTFSKGASCLF